MAHPEGVTTPGRRRVIVGGLSEVLSALVPDLLGLVVTPAAIVACLILLGSSRPLRNVGLFAAVYMAVYAAISTVVVAVGNAAGVATDSPGTTRGWISLVDPEPRLVIIASLLLSVINPNVAILLSGLGVLVTADVSTAEQVVGVLALLGASLLDFVIPVLAFVVSGEAGRAFLRRVTLWLIRHNQTLGVVLLTAFGLLFAVRGISQVT